MPRATLEDVAVELGRIMADCYEQQTGRRPSAGECPDDCVVGDWRLATLIMFEGRPAPDESLLIFFRAGYFSGEPPHR